MPERVWDVELSKSSLKALGRLGRRASTRILVALEELGGQENPLRHKEMRPLQGKFCGFYRFRVGEYRIIFEMDPENRRIGILAVVPRGRGYQ